MPGCLTPIAHCCVADDDASYTKEETKTQKFAAVVQAAGRGSTASLASSRSYDDFSLDLESGRPCSSSIASFGRKSVTSLVFILIS